MDEFFQDIEDITAIKNGDAAVIAEYALVLESKKINYFISESGTSLLVRNNQVERALYELHQYDLENIGWPPQKETIWYPPFYTPGVTYTLFFLLGLFYWYTGDWQPDNKWFLIGAVNRLEIVGNSQWWRLVTALTLHADLVHFIGNCVVGSHIILLLSRNLGYGLCWFLVLTTGLAGNFCNIIFRQHQHLSVGFSTSVFATLGIFTGLRLQFSRTTSLKDIILPLGAGAGLLVFFGSEGARTDIGAHFFGFSCGLLAGIVCNLSGVIKKFATTDRQSFLMAITLSIIALSWFFAIQGTMNQTY